MKRLRSPSTAEACGVVQRILILVACLALPVTACSSGGTSEPVSSGQTSSSQPAPSDEPTQTAAGGPLSGTWAGTIVSDRGGKGAFTVDLQQDGTAFTGQLRVPTSNCNKEATVSGTQEAGGQLKFGVSKGADLTATFTGTVDGTTMSGTWSSPAGGVCGADSGTWSGKKVS